MLGTRYNSEKLREAETKNRGDLSVGLSSQVIIRVPITKICRSCDGTCFQKVWRGVTSGSSNLQQ